MKLAIAALVAGSAAAFAPSASKAGVSGALSMGYENELGVIAPTGFFDPYGLSSSIDQETFDFYRAAELKHGRVAQLAVVGYVAAEIWRWPGEIAYGLPFADVPNGLAAFGTIPLAGWIQMIFAVGAVETYGWLGDFEIGKLPDLQDEFIQRRKLAELQHGRIAMLAVLELFRHDSQNLVSPGFDGLDNLITGLPFLYN
jgi:hypothetical protein